MSTLTGELCFLDVAERWILFPALVCDSIEELRLLILRVVNELHLLIIAVCLIFFMM